MNDARHAAANEIVRLTEALATAVDTLNATGDALNAAGAPTKAFPAFPYLSGIAAIAQKIADEAVSR